MLLERLMLLLPGGRLYWLMLVGLTAKRKHAHTDQCFKCIRSFIQEIIISLQLDITDCCSKCAVKLLTV